jgi:hypothetical protein
VENFVEKNPVEWRPRAAILAFAPVAQKMGSFINMLILLVFSSVKCKPAVNQR